MAGPLSPTPNPLTGDLSKDLGVPIDPTAAPSETQLAKLRGLVSGTVNPYLAQLRDDISEATTNILTPPSVRDAMGPLGSGLLRNVVGIANPVPGSVSDAAMMAAYGGAAALPTAVMRAKMAAGPLGRAAGPLLSASRVAAGAGGAAAGASLGGEDPSSAALQAIPGTLVGEALGPLGRRGRGQRGDIRRVTRAFDKVLVDQPKLPRDVQGLFQRAFAPGGIEDLATSRYRAQLAEISKLIQPNRPFLIPAISDNAVSWKQVTEWLSSKGAKIPKESKGPLTAGQKQALVDKRDVTSAVMGTLRNSPDIRDHKAADLMDQMNHDLFRNMTVARLLRSPGVLDARGQLNTQKLQQAFKLELTRKRIPADVFADVQKAIFRGAQPPATDFPGQGIHLRTGLGITGKPHVWLGLPHAPVSVGSPAIAGPLRYGGYPTKSVLFGTGINRDISDLESE